MARLAGDRGIGKRLGGEFVHPLDTRGRCTLDERIWRVLGEDVVLVVSELGCVCVYSLEQWDKALEEIDQYPPNNEGRKDYLRLLFPYVDEEVKCIKGKLLIPQRFREMAKLGDEIAVYGCGEWAEIWDPEERRRYMADTENFGGARRAEMRRAYARMTGAAAS